jgi:hypothetical protein
MLITGTVNGIDLSVFWNLVPVTRIAGSIKMLP